MNEKMKMYELAIKWYPSFSQKIMSDDERKVYHAEIEAEGVEAEEMTMLFLEIAFLGGMDLIKKHSKEEIIEALDVYNKEYDGYTDYLYNKEAKFFELSDNEIIGEFTDIELKGLRFLLSVLDLDKVHYILNYSSYMEVNIDGSFTTYGELNKVLDLLMEKEEVDISILKDEFIEALENKKDDKLIFKFTRNEIEALVLLFGELNKELINKVLTLDLDLEIDTDKVYDLHKEATDKLYFSLIDDLYADVDNITLSDEIAERFSKMV